MAQVSDAGAGLPQAEGLIRPGRLKGFSGPVEMRSLLERILDQAVALLACESGSISLVDEEAGTYTKEIDQGVACRQGSTFPLDEGMTGRIVAIRGAVILDEYATIGRGHIAPGDPRLHRAVVGVPIRWGERIIGTCVVFGGDRTRLFTTDDVLLLELLAQHAATAIVAARGGRGAADDRMARERHAETRALETLVAHLEALDPSPEALHEARTMARAALARRSDVDRQGGRSLVEGVEAELAWLRASAGVPATFTQAGAAVTRSSSVVEPALDFLREALQNVVDHAEATSVRVGLLWRPASVQLLVEDDGRGFDEREIGGVLTATSERVALAGGTVHVEGLPGWGTRATASLPVGGGTARSTAPVVFFGRPVVGAGISRILEQAHSRFRIVDGIDRDADPAAVCGATDPEVLLAEPDRVAGLMQLGRPLVVVVDRPAPEALRLAGEAGARGYLALDADADAVQRVLESVVQDRFGGGRIAPEADWTAVLTSREREVLALVVQGEADKRIAADLGISVKTVEKHVGALFRKSGLHNRTMLAAQQAGRTPPRM